LEHGFYDFPYIGNVIIPTDELIFFRGVKTTNHRSWSIKTIAIHIFAIHLAYWSYLPFGPQTIDKLVEETMSEFYGLG
jgi:hypothetical protein